MDNNATMQSDRTFATANSETNDNLSNEFHLIQTNKQSPLVPPVAGASKTVDQAPAAPAGKLKSYADNVGLVIDVYGGSAPFQQKAINAIEQLSDADRELLAKHNVHYAIANRLLDVAPDLANQHPRGWPADKGFADVDGVFLESRNTVLVAETTRNGISNRTLGAILHESGHAVDHSLGDFSKSPEFLAAYNADISKMPVPDKTMLQYLLQPGPGGPKETAADVFAALHGSSGNLDQTPTILRDFPAVELFIQREELDTVADGYTLPTACSAM
jgi:hypothetical protein